jgi:cytochrome c oxidase subunit 2
MEGIFLFNYHILFVILGIVVVVACIIYAILLNYTEYNKTNGSKFVHSNVIEIIWTTIPAIILLSLASPSFSLLYSLDEISNPVLTLKILGHQWYWSYETSDFKSCSESNTTLRYSSYMLTDEFLKENNLIGFFRILDVNKRLVLPTNTHLRLLLTAVDVLHSWTIPSFGVKIDACPGRLNQTNLFIKRFGVFFGQCSEICGINHGFMPVAVVAIHAIDYHCCIKNNLQLT